MRLKEIFQQNPFQNLIVAGHSAADLPLRGHEELLKERLEDIANAINNPDYPATAQHTIVFGEWGHGKTHVLRKIERSINDRFPQRARAVFYEPTESDHNAVLEELANKLKIEARDPRELIEKAKASFPENLFLLIDETQAIVGEKLTKDYEGNLRNYWQLLGDLLKAAEDMLYPLHIFHGLSLNSANAIKVVGRIPAIKQFRRHIFSLKSLDEDAQWRMLCDHIEKILNEQHIKAESIIQRGVNTCINRLTGGNPRYALSLMAQIFGKALSQGREKIDGEICYQTLCETPRFDASGRNYFDRFAIKDLLDQLRSGKLFEQGIAELLHGKIGSILGEWSEIRQDILAQYNLTTAKIRLSRQRESFRSWAT